MTPPPMITTSATLASAHHTYDLNAVAFVQDHIVVRCARHHVAVVGDSYHAAVDAERLQQRRDRAFGRQRARLTVQRQAAGLSDHALAATGVSRLAHASFSALDSSSAAAFGSSAWVIAETTATPAAPALISSSTLSAVTPPMANTGCETSFVMSEIRDGPTGFTSGFEALL